MTTNEEQMEISAMQLGEIREELKPKFCKFDLRQSSGLTNDTRKSIKQSF